MLESVRQRLKAARPADIPELGQAKIRLWGGFIIIPYFVVSFVWDGALDIAEQGTLAMMAGYYLLAAVILTWIVLRPGLNHWRRRAASLLDMGATTLIMVRAGEAATVMYGMYLWVMIGNGFRFGRWYLHYAQVLAIAGFIAVLLLSEYWRLQATLGAGLLLALIAVPWYFSLLLSRLQQARAEAEAANIAKTKLLAAASHDLRQPMQALSMYATVLERRMTDANALRVLHGIQLSVAALERMFDSLLDISRIESGVIKPNVVVFALMPVIERVVEAERTIAAQKGLQLRVASTSAKVRSDPALLERMLKNLVTNAIRYTEHGGIVIGCRRLGRDIVRLNVIDSGIGIALEERKRIFDEYYQLSGSSAQGLGLGLPIVKSLGELLGHHVSVKSAPGRGSVFSIELARAPDLTPAIAAVPPPAGALSRLNVVLVDDDVEIRESLSLLLQSWGSCCVSGATIAEVEEKLKVQGIEPDALIVDYRLTDTMTGLQVIERLRAVFGSALPALVITGTPNAALLQQQASGIPFALKPVSPGKLRAFLSQIARPRGDATDSIRTTPH